MVKEWSTEKALQFKHTQVHNTETKNLQVENCENSTLKSILEVTWKCRKDSLISEQKKRNQPKHQASLQVCVLKFLYHHFLTSSRGGNSGQLLHLSRKKELYIAFELQSRVLGLFPKAQLSPWRPDSMRTKLYEQKSSVVLGRLCVSDFT
ncbi:uncharacterized protein LOC143441780 [Arvicanthis niloticus]|uniref:uncharacterized protein LOC143312009 n=1 Tax=Arvicanthis niloticus TaxID=61156 RepID=UPI00402B26E7